MTIFRARISDIGLDPALSRQLESVINELQTKIETLTRENEQLKKALEVDTREHT